MSVPRNFNLLAGFAFAASLASLAVHIVGDQALIYIFKPLAALLLLTLAIHNWTRTRQSPVLWISLGLLFSLAGDTFLIDPGKFFLPGLAAFLLTHLAYLVAFTRDAKFPARPLVWLLFLAIAAANFFALKPHLPTALTIPVPLYAFALSTMTAQAIGRSLLLRTSAAKLAAFGAFFFLISDTLLAWDRFHTRLPLASFLILVPYYIAQLLIAFSTSPGTTTLRHPAVSAR